MVTCVFAHVWSPLPPTSRHPGPTRPPAYQQMASSSHLSGTSVRDSGLPHGVFLVLTGKVPHATGQFLVFCLLLSSVPRPCFSPAVPLCGLLNAPVSYSQPPPPHCCWEQSLSSSSIQIPAGLLRPYVRKYKTITPLHPLVFFSKAWGQENRAWQPTPLFCLEEPGGGPQGLGVGPVT